ncbi:MAG: HD domain-containing protein [Phycisphaerales bacterium]|nr:MAG: HD domain-containing protein [Phycisphaerales bacterium]
MSSAGGQLVLLARPSALHRRLRRTGLLLLTCDPTGCLVGPTQRGEDWLTDMFCASPIFRQALREAAARWQDDPAPAELEVMPGLWLSPAPLLERRKPIGYAVTVIPTGAFLDAEQLPALCQASEQDLEMARRLLHELSPPSRSDVHRIAALVRFAHEDQRRMAAENRAMETVGQQLGESYEEINLLYTIIRSMTEVQNPGRFVEIACDELLETLPYAWIGALMADDVKRLKSLACAMTIAGEPGHGPEELRPLLEQLLNVTEAHAPVVLEPAFNANHARFLPLGGTALAHPVSSDGKVIGLLVAGDKQGSDPAASSVDMKMLGATATHLAIFLENAALYDDLNAMFIGTLEALTASIDAKDRYTCGHSQRVARLTQQLAIALGLDEETVGRMRIAGLVHDVGKIGVPEGVLTKPGRLNEEEFELIREHPEIGHRILKDIPQLQDILPGVLHHHERWDGRGYPHGLAGEDIPVVARCIALADSFDAMSSTRTYRARLTRDEVFEEIRRCSGGQFDPQLVPILEGMDFSEFDHLIVEHRAGESLEYAPEGEAA